ncbi:hypothetical protein SVAN01_04095 [Stagonosporopsis vannaccii]|nr:hypothetical protein SVAN01_04095 [Stagonosporopsis vannaccii]
MLMLRVEVHLALFCAEQSRKDPQLALARQCCDCSMNYLCDFACSYRRRKRGAGVREIADSIVLMHPCDVA